MLMRHQPMIKAMSFVGQGNQNTGGGSNPSASDFNPAPEDFSRFGDTYLNGDHDASMDEVSSCSVAKNGGTAGKTVPGRGLKQAHQKRVRNIKMYYSAHTDSRNNNSEVYKSIFTNILSDHEGNVKT